MGIQIYFDKSLFNSIQPMPKVKKKLYGKVIGPTQLMPNANRHVLLKQDKLMYSVGGTFKAINCMSMTVSFTKGFLS